MTEPTQDKARRDLAGALGSLLGIGIGVAALWYSAEFSMLGAVFPRTIAGLLVLFSALYLGLVVLGKAHGGPRLHGSPIRRVALALVMLGWAFALVPLGFLLSSGIAFVLLMLIANYDGWSPRKALTYVAAGGVMLGGLYTLFKYLLLVPLP